MSPSAAIVPLPPSLPDGWYRAARAGGIDTLRCTAGAWFNRQSASVPVPEGYAPLDRSAA